MTGKTSLCSVVVVCLLSPVVAQKPKPTSTLTLGKDDHVLLEGINSGVGGVSFSPDGQSLASASGDGIVRLFDLQSFREIRQFKGHKGFIRTVVFSPDGKLLASGGDEQGAFVWDVATGKRLRVVGKHNGNLRRVVFSPNGKILATSGFDEHIGLWEVATGKKLHFFRAHPRVAYALAFSPNGTTLASGGDRGGSLRFWDVSTGKQTGNWDCPLGSIYALQYSPDGQTIATGDNKAVRLWDVESGKQLHLLDHGSQVGRLAFSHDGRVLVTASYSGHVHLWETITGDEIHRFGKHDGWVWGVDYAPNGQSVASCSRDGKVVYWSMSTVLGQTTAPNGLTDKDLEASWQLLATRDAGKAFRAVHQLSTGSPAKVVPFLREQLKPEAERKADVETIKRLIVDLDARNYRRREQAMKELERIGYHAEAALKQALVKTDSLEVQTRISTLLAKLKPRTITPEELRRVRILAVLEKIDTPESRTLVQQLAKGAPGKLTTREAKAVLARLEKD